jgi:predicted metal-binding membrane protein
VITYMASTTRDSPQQPAHAGKKRGLTALLDRSQIVLLVLLALLTAGAWALTIHQARTMEMPMGVIARGGAEMSAMSADANSDSGDMDGMSGMSGMSGMDDSASDAPDDAIEGAETAAASGMAGMEMGGWTWDGFATFLIAWAVMMAAMMFPAAAPMLLLFRKVSASRPAHGRAAVPTWLFTAGYLLIWTGIGVVTWALVQATSELAGRISSADRETWAPIALGAVLLLAGLYQLTPIKRACLDHCRTPVGFVMRYWCDGRLGALRMGLRHGVYCLGCCWALFAVLVAAGVMSLAWMLLLTLIVFAEKVLPPNRWTPQVVGGVFVVLAIVVGAGAFDMPWIA